MREIWFDAMSKHATRTAATELSNEVMRGEDANLLGVVLRHRVLKSTTPPLVVTRAERTPPGQPALRSQQKAAPRRTAP